MRRMAARMILGCALIGVGWTVGRAQAAIPDFEVAIDAVVGTTHVECVRGCALRGARDATVREKQAKPTYTFSCSGPRQVRCSATVHGFLQR